MFIYILNALEVGKLPHYAQLAYLQPDSEAAIDGMYLNICVSDNCVTNSQTEQLFKSDKYFDKVNLYALKPYLFSARVNSRKTRSNFSSLLRY